MRSYHVVTPLFLLLIGSRLSGQVTRAPSLLPEWAIDQDAYAPATASQLSGVRLGFVRDSVLSHLGAPDRETRHYSEILDSTTVFEYAWGRVLLSDRSGVEDFECWGDPCTLKGVRIGATVLAVVDALGAGRSGYGRSPTRLLLYPVQRCDCWVQVEFDERNRVRQLALHFDNS